MHMRLGETPSPTTNTRMRTSCCTALLQLRGQCVEWRAGNITMKTAVTRRWREGIWEMSVSNEPSPLTMSEGLTSPVPSIIATVMDRCRRRHCCARLERAPLVNGGMPGDRMSVPALIPRGAGNNCRISVGSAPSHDQRLSTSPLSRVGGMVNKYRVRVGSQLFAW